MRQAEHDVACRHRARRRGRLDYGRQLVVGEAGYQRCHDHRHRDAGGGQPGDRVEPASRSGRARFHPSLQFVLQRRDGESDQSGSPSGQLAEQVDVPGDEEVLGGDRHGIPELGQHRETTARQLQAALHRLVGVGDTTQQDGLRWPTRRAEGGAQ